MNAKKFNEALLRTHRAWLKRRRVFHWLFAAPLKQLEDDGVVVVRAVDRDEIEVRFAQEMMTTEPEVVTVTHPKTWVDAALDRWCPKPLRRWLHVDYVTTRVERYCAYPQIPLPDRSGTYAAFPQLNRSVTEWTDDGTEDEE